MRGQGVGGQKREKRSAESEPPKRRRKPRPQLWIMTREECAVIKAMPNIHCATGLRNRAMMELMHRAGLRVSEACGMLSRDVLGIEEGDTVRPSARVLGKGAKWRTIGLDSTCVHWMRRWNDTRRGRRISGKTFCPTLKGGKISTRYIQDLFQRLRLRAAEMQIIPWERAQKITPHKLRHAFATEACEEMKSPEDLARVRDQLGHSNIAITSIYTHVRDGAMADFLADRKPDLPLE